MLQLFIGHSVRRLVRYVSEQPLARGVTIAAFCAVFVGLGLAVYAFFSEGFAFITQESYFERALPFYMYEVFLLVVSLLVFASALITALFQLYRSQRDRFIVASPGYHVVPFYVYLRVFVSSLWPVLIIALPAAIAMAQAFATGVASIVLVVLASILLVACVVAIAMTLLIGVGVVVEWLGYRPSLNTLIVVAGAALAAVSWAAWEQIALAEVVTVFQAENLAQAQAGIESIAARFTAFPSHVVALIMAALQQAQYVAAMTYVVYGALGTLAVFGVYALVAWQYLPVWQRLQEGGFTADPRERTTRRAAPLPRMTDSVTGVLFEKEIAQLVRNRRELLWLSFLLLLWLAQTGLNTFAQSIDAGSDAATLATSHFVHAMQVLLVVYFAAALVLRFAFPSFSTERNTGWILLSAPISMVRTFWSKLLFFSTLFGGLSILIALANVWILALAPTSAVLFVLLCVLATVTVTVLGVSMGALFPRFETDDPQQLGTSMPGIGLIVASLLYGAVGASSFFVVLMYGTVAPVIGFALLSVAIMTGAVALAERAVGDMRLTPTVRA
jgi:ABC-2 type transport system permease protein